MRFEFADSRFGCFGALALVCKRSEAPACLRVEEAQFATLPAQIQSQSRAVSLQDTIRYILDIYGDILTAH